MGGGGKGKQRKRSQATGEEEEAERSPAPPQKQRLTMQANAAAILNLESRVTKGQQETDSKLVSIMSALGIKHQGEQDGERPGAGASPTKASDDKKKEERRARSSTRSSSTPRSASREKRRRGRRRTRSRSSTRTRTPRRSRSRTPPRYRHPHHDDRRGHAGGEKRDEVVVATYLARALGPGILPKDEGMPHTYVSRGDKNVKISRGEATLAEYVYGFCRIMADEQSITVREYMLEHLTDITLDACTRPWPAVRAFSEKAVAAVLDKKETAVRWGAKSELRHLQSLTYTNPAYLEPAMAARPSGGANGGKAQRGKEDKGKPGESVSNLHLPRFVRSAPTGPPCKQWNEGKDCGHGDHHLVEGKRALHICSECMSSEGRTATHRQKDCRGASGFGRK